MNGLSWFLYLAEVVGKLGGLAATGSFFGSLLFAGACFWWLMWKVDGDKMEIPKPPVKAAGFIWVLCLTVFITVPSKETIYLIAGSQAGETVVTSEIGQEILNDIQQVIKYQLGELKGGKQ